MTKLAVFIDADNFSDCTALDHAMTAVRGLGEHIVFKHAYGNAHSLKGIEVVLAKYGIRPISNLVVGKTTTDVALAIGAIEAVCRNPDIRTAVICSGDADFAPLAIRLEELGCKAICIGRHGNIFHSADAFYDEVIEVKVIEDTEKKVRALSVLAPSAIATEPLVAPPTVSKSVLATKVPATKNTTPLPATVSVKQVLKALPALKNGDWQAMSVVVRTLREAKTIGANTALQQWFTPIQAHFEVELSTGKKIKSATKRRNRQVYPPRRKSPLQHNIFCKFVQLSQTNNGFRWAWLLKACVTNNTYPKVQKSKDGFCL